MKRRQYSASFKARIVAAKLAGSAPAELAAKHNIDVALIYAWVGKAKKARGTVAAKGNRMRALQVPTDAERIVDKLLASLRPGLVSAIGKLVDLGIERKLGQARTNVLNALKGAA